MSAIYDWMIGTSARSYGTGENGFFNSAILCESLSSSVLEPLLMY